MILKFIVYELQESSTYYKTIFNGGNRPNKFIVVGEEGSMFKLQQIEEDGISFLGELTIDEFTIMLPKEDMKLKGDGVSTEIQEFDIPKKYLTLDIIETIKRLNNCE